MALSNKILKLKDHALKINDAWIKNTEKPEQGTDKDTTTTVSEVVGDMAPHVNINGYTFDSKDISYFEVSEKDMLPFARVVINDPSGVFTNKFFPTNKSVMQVYIKAPHKRVKALRCDFLIGSILPIEDKSSKNPQSAEGRGHQYVVSGNLNVPKMYNSDVNYYKGSAMDSLMKIAGDIGIGFASNEVSTSDSMTWLQPSIPYSELIDDITNRTYKDGDSFYTSFVDRAYNLTLVNINDMLSQEEDFDMMFSSVLRNKEHYTPGSNGTSKNDDDEPQDNFLTNYSHFRGSSSYITSIIPISKQGKILTSEPNRRILYYYDINISDKNNEKFLDFFIEQFGSTITAEDIGKNVCNSWEGILNTNVHDNYIYAKHSNNKNMLDFKKNKMLVTLEGANMNIIRGMRIPLVIVKEGLDQEIREEIYVPDDKNKDIEEDSGKQVVKMDKDKTGYYVVDAVKFIFDKDGGNYPFNTVLELCRASWGDNIEFDN